MKISNKFLSREFVYDENQFYTKKIVNKRLNKTVKNKNLLEFQIVFETGNPLTSQQFQATILEKKKDKLVVNFARRGTELTITYAAREDVLEKKVTLIKSSRSINYIDVDLLEFDNTEGVFYPKKQSDIKEMAGFPGYYVECGQPIYAKSLFFGMEFPMGENRVQETHYFSRYYVGYVVRKPKEIWPVIIGAASGEEKETIQKDFFKYIEGIAQPNAFRKQYNSWFDYMTDIDEQKVLYSFAEIYHGFEGHGVHLDAYVVDDGWPNYESMWEFNEKFPKGLSKIRWLAKQQHSSLGLWIGPRGGYNGTEVKMSDWLEAHPEFGSKNKLFNDVNLGDFKYLRHLKSKMLKYQKAYDISYWKIDGWLLKPDKPDSSGEYAMHTMVPVYEFLVELLKDLRAERGKKDFWLNLTSYVNPSPWFLQWVNSLWLQTSQDVGFTEGAGNDINRMITYRDIQYQEFLERRDLQLPLSSIYSHEPIYAATAHTWYMDHQMYATVKEFEEYLMFISTRGNAFWEFHYSYSMFDEERWQANARAVQWIEANYDTLKYSRRIGGKPDKFEIYGYHCVNPINGTQILSLRNPHSKSQKIKLSDIKIDNFSIVIGEFKQQGNEIELAPYTILILKK